MENSFLIQLILLVQKDLLISKALQAHLNTLFQVILFCIILHGEEKNYPQRIRREMMKILQND